MNNTYFLLRHGQTIYQTEKLDEIYPWPDSPPVTLTKDGEEMIKAAAHQLKKENINLIFASDTHRVKQSAEIVEKELGIKSELDRRLRDSNFGSYNGGTISEFNNKFDSPKKRFLERSENGECRKDVKERVEGFLEEVEKKYENKNILIISHGDPLLMLEGIIKGLKTDEEFIEFTTGKDIQNVGELRRL